MGTWDHITDTEEIEKYIEQNLATAEAYQTTVDFHKKVAFKWEIQLKKLKALKRQEDFLIFCRTGSFPD